MKSCFPRVVADNDPPPSPNSVAEDGGLHLATTCVAVRSFEHNRELLDRLRHNDAVLRSYGQRMPTFLGGFSLISCSHVFSG